MYDKMENKFFLPSPSPHVSRFSRGVLREEMDSPFLHYFSISSPVFQSCGLEISMKKHRVMLPKRRTGRLSYILHAAFGRGKSTMRIHLTVFKSRSRYE